jgi:UDP-3-O-[3-hydroxymyristoyl] glucosamine N-acyltransferase
MSIKSFFINTGPYDINEILSKTIYSNKKKNKNDLIFNVSSLSDGEKGDISFIENYKYLKLLKSTKVSYCFTREKNIDLFKDTNVTPIISTEPLLDFVLTANLFYPDASKDNFKIDVSEKFKKYLDINTFIDRDTKISKNFSIGSNTVIKKNVIIGNNVSIGSNCSISNCILEDNVIINDNTTIGKIGFGFKYIDNKFFFIPHIGHVLIGKNSYISSGCTIDRGSFTNTVIGHNTKIDNQVHIAHNVKIGSYCNIAAQVGIAGSAIIGDNCMIGGQSGVSGHLKIGKNVFIGGKSGVINDIEDNTKVMGYPATSIKNFIKNK